VPRQWEITVQLKTRKRSPYLYTVYHPYPGADPVRASTGTRDRGQAEEIRTDLERRLRREAALGGKPRYSDLTVTYIKTAACHNTRRAWKASNRRWDLRLRDLCLVEITGQMILEHIAERRAAGIKDGSIRADLGFLSGLFAFTGVPKADNPVLQLEHGLKPGGERFRFLLPEEETAALGACYAEEHALTIIFAVETGLRSCAAVAGRQSQTGDLHPARGVQEQEAPDRPALEAGHRRAGPVRRPAWQGEAVSVPGAEQ
jgi:integrase